MKKKLSILLSMLTGGVAGATAIYVQSNKKIMKKNDHSKKMGEFYHLLNLWLKLKQEGRSLTEFFESKGYKSVAIYGMKELGERLREELKDSDIEVKYIIDKRADSIYEDIDVVTPDDDLEEVDVIVVTAIHYFHEINEMLRKRVGCPVISLEDIIYEM